MNRLTEGLLLSAVLLLCSLDVNSDTFGIEDSDVVTRSGDHKCSAQYDHGSWPNNLCHIEISAIAGEITGSRWSGVAVLIAKELTDENIDKSDIWTAPFWFTKRAQIAVNLEGDFIIGYSFKF